MSLLPFIYEFTFLLPLLTFFIFKRKEKEWAVRVVLYYAIYCILQEAATLISPIVVRSYLSSTGLEASELRRKWLEITGNFVPILFAAYTIIEFTFFCIFYQLLFPRNHSAKRYTQIIWAFFVAFALIDYLLINSHQAFDSFAIGIESLILILMCGYYLYYQVTHTMTMMVYNTFNFWVIVTFFMYISATFFLYLMTDAMGEDPEFRRYYFFINFGANILKNLLLAYAFTRVFIPPLIEKKDRITGVDLGDELILQQNT